MDDKGTSGYHREHLPREADIKPINLLSFLRLASFAQIHPLRQAATQAGDWLLGVADISSASRSGDYSRAAPFLMESQTGSAPIFFGTIFVVVAIGAFIPLLFGSKEGQRETVTEAVLVHA